MNSVHRQGLVSSYVNETLRKKDVPKVEEMIATDAILNEYFLRKIQEKDFRLQLIPDKKLTQNKLRGLKTEIQKINENVFPKEKYSLVKKVIKHLKEPAFTIEL